MVHRRRSSANLQENKVQVLVMGSSNVGKTTMIERFTREKIVKDEGTDINNKEVEVEIIVELMDIQDTLEPQMRRFAVETAHAYILMYSVDDPQSFSKTDLLKDEIVKVKGPGMPMVVVGNKADLSKTKSKTVTINTDDRNDGDIPHIKMSLQKRRNTCEIYEQLFKHQTLRKLTEVVSKVNNCTLFTDLRRLSLRAEQLEENMAIIFPPTPKSTKSTNNPQYSWSMGMQKVKSLFNIGN